MGAILFFSFLFLGIVFGLPVFWQIRKPSLGSSLRFLWKVINLVLLIGFFVTYSRVSWAGLLLLPTLVFILVTRKNVAGTRKEDPKANTTPAAVSK